ncbi:pentapeptide repeat-containing protein [Maridesulfovibrio sp.]|uniref:pentapeptide repeat-containing protein n=1 Tax=Maridesulfovibrio sp. TaxID=2795000 RepID=UPI002AA8D12F|nr:pentapeptide repeat-containing protein [Maridesulfovibrio sp.]
MACCMDAKFGWCAGEDIVYKDSKGKEYCLFHAPAEHKYSKLYVEGKGQRPELVSDTDFNTFVLSKIKKCIQSGADEWQGNYTWWANDPRCNLAGTIFPWDITFESIDKLPAIKFDECKFKGIVDFSDCIFEVQTCFFHTVFEDPVIFANNTFNGPVHFDGSTFDYQSNPERSIYCYDYPQSLEDLGISCGCSFFNITFKDDVSYGRCLFNAKIKFKHCHFEKKCTFLDFNRTIFNDEFSFIRNIVNDAFDLGRCIFNSTIKITSCDFLGMSSFKKSKFIEAKLVGTQFHKNIVFAEANTSKRLIIEDCIFKKEIMFAHANINIIRIRYSYFNSPSFFSGMFGRCRLYIGNSHFDDMVQFNGNSYNGFQILSCSFKKLADFSNTTHNEIENKSNPNQHYCCMVNNCTFDSWVYFKDTTFKSIATFENTISGQKIIFERANMCNVSLKRMNIESFQFIECLWHKDKNKYGPLYNENPKNKSDKLANSTLESTYRRLKRIAKDGSDEVQTSHWHYKEKEMQAKNVRTILHQDFMCHFFLVLAVIISSLCLTYYDIPFSVGILAYLTPIVLIFKLYKKSEQLFAITYYSIYNLISGYGEKPLRALIWLTIFILLPAFIPIDLTTYKDPQWIKDTVNYLPLTQTSSETSYLSILIHGLGRILIAVQAALFAFALRNKLRR